MNAIKKRTFYSPREEKVNVLSHGAGLLGSILALILMLRRAILFGSTVHIISAMVFGLALILLYTASTLYHGAEDAKRRNRLRVFDHASIYILIAGSYTPFTLITLQGTTGWLLFGIIWFLAFCGVIIKLFLTGRYEILLTIMYIALGWIIVFALKPLFANLALKGVILLFAGGISYTLGAIVYGIKKIRGNHAIFHFFVLIGSFCHFLSVYCFVLSGTSA